MAKSAWRNPATAGSMVNALCADLADPDNQRSLANTGPDDDDPVRIQVLKNSADPDDRALGAALERRQRYLRESSTVREMENRAGEYMEKNPSVVDPVINRDPDKWTIPQLNEYLTTPRPAPPENIERPMFDPKRGWVTGPENPIISDEPGSTPAAVAPRPDPSWKPDA